MYLGVKSMQRFRSLVPLYIQCEKKKKKTSRCMSHKVEHAMKTFFAIFYSMIHIAFTEKNSGSILVSVGSKKKLSVI